MTTTFTPGPWILAKDGHGIYSNDDFGILADCYGTPSVREANARLMAAAPKLYETLRAFYDHLDDRFEGDATEAALLDRAKALLAKVDGADTMRQRPDGRG